MALHILSDATDNTAAVIESLPEGGPADWRYHEGKPLQGEFPRGASVQFSCNHPDLRELRDFIPNPLSVLIVSGRVRAILEQAKANACEFLPIKVINHAGGVAADDYAILNPLGGLPVIDLKRTAHTMDAMEKDQIDDITSLVTDPGVVPVDRLIFRASLKRRLFFIQDTLRTLFENHGVTGWRTWPTEGWDGLYI